MNTDNFEERDFALPGTEPASGEGHEAPPDYNPDTVRGDYMVQKPIQPDARLLTDEKWVEIKYQRRWDLVEADRAARIEREKQLEDALTEARGLTEDIGVAFDSIRAALVTERRQHAADQARIWALEGMVEDAEGMEARLEHNLALASSQLTEARAQVDALNEHSVDNFNRYVAAHTALERLEWAQEQYRTIECGGVERLDACPACFREREQGHTPDCWLDAALHPRGGSDDAAAG